MTVDGVTRPLPAPFMVIATQNPIEYEGTFPLPGGAARPVHAAAAHGLPRADRGDGHPRRAEARPPGGGAGACRRRWRRSLAMQQAVREIYVDPAISDYIVRLVGATRTHPDVYLGASPRGSLGALPRRPGVRGARWPRLRHPRRHQGPGGAGAWPTGSCSRRRRRSAASTAAASSASCSRACPSEPPGLPPSPRRATRLRP